MFKRNLFYLLIVATLIGSTILAGCAKTTPTTAPATTTAAPPATSPAPTTKPPTTAPAPFTTPAPTTIPAPTSAVQTGGILTIISPNSPSSFGYPIQWAGFAPNFVTPPCLEGFIDSDIKGNLRPKLATSWDTAADGSSITFHLRQGVKFHDGTDFDATAAKWNLDLYLQRGTGSPARWQSVEALDKNTIRINLKPNSYSNTQLTQGYVFISPTAVQKNGVDWAITHPVGTGPFKFKSFVRDTSLEYERFDGYWGDKARVDGMKYLFIVDPTTAGMAFKGGDAQIWESADPKTAYDLVTKLGFKRETRRGACMNFVPDSAHADSPFSSLKVRQAAEYAIDRQGIVNTLGYGTWEAVDQPCAPEQFGHVDGLVDYPYNPAKAKQLLADAGYPNGFSTTIITSSAFPQDPLVAIQSYLAAVGIKATIDVQSPPKWAATRTAGYSNGLFYVTHGATDFNYCAYLERYYLPGGLSFIPVMAIPSGWTDALNKMLATSDPAVYKPMAQALVKQYVDFAMEFPLWVQSEVYVLDPWINEMGVGTHGDGFSWDYNKVWIGKH